MSVLIFSTCKAPLAQPSNAILGNTFRLTIQWKVVPERAADLRIQGREASCASILHALVEGCDLVCWHLLASGLESFTSFLLQNIEWN